MVTRTLLSPVAINIYYLPGAYCAWQALFKIYISDSFIVKKISTQTGITLMELIAAVSIISIMIIAAIALYDSVNRTQVSNQLMSEFMALKIMTKDFFSGYKNYGQQGADISNLLVASGKIPESIKVLPSGVIKNAVGGDITITSNGDGSFRIKSTAISSDICILILTKVNHWAWGQVGSLNPFVIGDTSLSPEAADQLCNGDHVDITLSTLD